MKLFNPRSFLSATQLVFEEYYRINGKYPKKWAQIPNREWRNAASNVCILLPENFSFPDGNVLRFEKKGLFADKEYMYIIGKSLDEDYLINSENNDNVRDWICDKRGCWWFFADKKNELIAVDSCFERMHSRSVEIKNLGLHFQDERAFKYLFAILEDSKKSDDEKISVALSMLNDFPHLERFSSYSPKLNDIISLSSREMLVSDLKRIDKELNGNQFFVRKGWKIIIP